VADEATQQPAAASPWERPLTPSEQQAGTGQSTSRFVLQSVTEIVGLVILCGIILTVAWAFLLYR
jgi:hypothetical protein